MNKSEFILWQRLKNIYNIFFIFSCFPRFFILIKLSKIILKILSTSSTTPSPPRLAASSPPSFCHSQNSCSPPFFCPFELESGKMAPSSIFRAIQSSSHRICPFCTILTARGAFFQKQTRNSPSPADRSIDGRVFTFLVVIFFFAEIFHIPPSAFSFCWRWRFSFVIVMLR